LTARQVAEWAAYYRIEPWGEERGDYRAAIISSTVYNMQRGKKSKPLTPKDFMPKFGRDVGRSLASKVRQTFSRLQNINK